MPATTPGRLRSEQVAAFDRNAWPRSIAIPGRNRRNPQACDATKPCQRRNLILVERNSSETRWGYLPTVNLVLKGLASSSRSFSFRGVSRFKALGGPPLSDDLGGRRQPGASNLINRIRSPRPGHNPVGGLRPVELGGGCQSTGGGDDCTACIPGTDVRFEQLDGRSPLLPWPRHRRGRFSCLADFASVRALWTRRWLL
jgi:hypothetical protein